MNKYNKLNDYEGSITTDEEIENLINMAMKQLKSNKEKFAFLHLGDTFVIGFRSGSNVEVFVGNISKHGILDIGFGEG